jgi:hypothetical protein
MEDRKGSLRFFTVKLRNLWSDSYLSDFGFQRSHLAVHLFSPDIVDARREAETPQ